MKAQYFTAASLDGLIVTAKDSLDWLLPLGGLNDASSPELISDVDALAMGSASEIYERMAHNAEKVAA